MKIKLHGSDSRETLNESIFIINLNSCCVFYVIFKTQTKNKLFKIDSVAVHTF